MKSEFSGFARIFPDFENPTVESTIILSAPTGIVSRTLV